MDTTEATMEGTLSCTSACHDKKPHDNSSGNGQALNKHTRKVACETCHTGLRPASALESRKWNEFVSGKPVTTKRAAGWLPEHKWYDNTGPGATGDYHLPILYHTERRDVPKAKIYPFNPVTVDWYVKDEESGFDDVIIVPEVKAADANADGTVTLEEMRAGGYPNAMLMTADMNFSINHSVTPKELSFDCNDCHGRNGWVLDWTELGYAGDPRMKSGRNKDKGKNK
jgi:methanogenesis multiheme c-type cytochrome